MLAAELWKIHVRFCLVIFVCVWWILSGTMITSIWKKILVVLLFIIFVARELSIVVCFFYPIGVTNLLCPMIGIFYTTIHKGGFRTISERGACVCVCVCVCVWRRRRGVGVGVDLIKLPCLPSNPLWIRHCCMSRHYCLCLMVAVKVSPCIPLISLCHFYFYMQELHFTIIVYSPLPFGRF